jgi:ABC-2 type transport system ATP-binding protein
MRRRLDLAASLVHRPAVLFLDEPTTGLDPRSRNELWLVIEDLVADGTTVLLTTQYLEEADRLADNLAVVDHGRIIAMGTPTELKAGLGSTVVEIEMPGEGSALMALQALERLGVAPPTIDGTTVTLTVAGGGASLLEALRALDAEGIVPTGVALREPSLDDVFLSLTGHAAAEASAA